MESWQQNWGGRRTHSSEGSVEVREAGGSKPGRWQGAAWMSQSDHPLFNKMGKGRVL